MTGLPPGGRVIAAAARDGARLRTAWWPGGPAGTVLLLHGRSECAEKYAEVIGELRARDLAVWTFDWRGQGLSARRRLRPQAGHVDDFAVYLDDLGAALAQTLPDAAPRPRIVLAHSMGGHLAVRALAERRLDAAAAILSAPMLRIALAPGVQAAVRPLARMVTALGGGGRYVPGQHDFDPARAVFAGNRLTGDAGRFERNVACLRAHPELRVGGVTWGWLDAERRSAAFVDRPAAAAGIAVPVLVLQAGSDRVVDTGVMADFATRLPQGRLVRIAGARHELLMESDAVRAQVWREIDAFLAGLAPDPAAATERRGSAPPGPDRAAGSSAAAPRR